MANGKLAVGRGVSGTEAWPAEAFPQDRSRRDQVGGLPAFYKCRQDGHRARIEVQAERAVSDAFAAKQARCSTEVVIGPSGTPGDLALIRPDASVPDLAQQVHPDALELPVRIQLCLMQDVLRIFLQLMNAVDLRRMHGQRDGAFDARQIDPHAAVIPRHLPRRHLLPGLRPPVLLIPALRLLIRRPDRRPAGRLCGHDVNGAAVLRGKTGNARPYEFADPVFDIAVVIDLPDDAQGRVLRTDPGLQRTGQIHGDHPRPRKVIAAPEQLLGQLTAAFPDTHAAQRPVARVRVRAEDHPPAPGHRFAVVAVDVCQIGRNVDAPVAVGGGQGKLVVVLVDRPADRAQRVVAVGEHVGEGKGRHARCPCRLDDAHIGDVVAGHRVKVQTQPLRVPGPVVRRDDAPGHRAVSGLGLICRPAGQHADLFRFRLGYNIDAVYQINAAVIQFHHDLCLRSGLSFAAL